MKKKMEMGGWVKIKNVNTLQMSMKMSPNERGASISISKILDLREGLMEFIKFEKNNGEIWVQSFNYIKNKMVKSSIKMKKAELNLKRKN